MSSDNNATNLRLISSNGGGPQRNAPLDALGFVQTVTATLDLDAVIERINEHLAEHLGHSGWIFTSDQGENWQGGEIDRHRIEYALRYNGTDLGSLALMRGRRFDDQEQALVESVLGLAAPALHNAWRFRRLRANLERDELTGLGNRRAFEAQGEQWLSDCLRQGRSLSLLTVDLDHFKQLHDRFGHTVGDEILREVASALRDSTRQSDLCVRMGGEEFLVLLPGADLRAGMECAERIRQAIARIRVAARAEEGAPVASDGVATITASVGVSTLGRHTTLQSLYQKADEALYAAKASGRDRVLAGH